MLGDLDSVDIKPSKHVKDVAKALADCLADKNAANKPLAAQCLGMLFLALDLKSRQEVIAST